MNKQSKTTEEIREELLEVLFSTSLRRGLIPLAEHIKENYTPNDQVRKMQEEEIKNILHAYDKWQWEEPKDGKRILASEMVNAFTETYLSEQETKHGK